MPPSPSKAGEALSYVQGESPKGSAAVVRRLSNPPVTRALALVASLTGSAMITQPVIKKPKQPLDYILRQMHDAMKMVFSYDHDPNFVPCADELVLLDMIQKQFADYCAMAAIIVATLRQRAMKAAEAETPPP
jgi:hypothetical protein